MYYILKRIKKIMIKMSTENSKISKLLSEDLIIKKLLDLMPAKSFAKDRNSVWLYADEKMSKDVGLTSSSIRGKSDFDLFPKELAEKYSSDDKRIMDKGSIETLDERYDIKGIETVVRTVKIPLKDENGKSIGICGYFQDITKEKHMEDRIKAQAREILEASTPVIQIIPGILVAPIIGTLDSSRTQEIMERILNKIVESHSSVAILDITGVPTVDTATASNLIETITAVKLLGAQVIVTGISPIIAQTMVHLGVNLTSFLTFSSLEYGLRTALELIGLKIFSKDTK
jgi:rsbT co-antagonist protein RsbR